MNGLRKQHFGIWIEYTLTRQKIWLVNMAPLYRGQKFWEANAPLAPPTSTSPAVQQHTAHRTTILNQPQQIGFRGFGTPTILNISLYLYVYNASVKWPTVKVIVSKSCYFLSLYKSILNEYRHSSYNAVLLYRGILSNAVFSKPKTALKFYLTRFFLLKSKIKFFGLKIFFSTFFFFKCTI